VSHDNLLKPYAKLNIVIRFTSEEFIVGDSCSAYSVSSCRRHCTVLLSPDILEVDRRVQRVVTGGLPVSRRTVTSQQLQASLYCVTVTRYPGGGQEGAESGDRRTACQQEDSDQSAAAGVTVLCYCHQISWRWTGGCREW
jgi:hypothetical protein